MFFSLSELNQPPTFCVFSLMFSGFFYSVVKSNSSILTPKSTNEHDKSYSTARKHMENVISQFPFAGYVQKPKILSSQKKCIIRTNSTFSERNQIHLDSLKKHQPTIWNYKGMTKSNIFYVSINLLHISDPRGRDYKNS